MWSVSYVTCIDLIAQISLTRLSAFLFLDMPTLKLRMMMMIMMIMMMIVIIIIIIIIIILPTNRPEIILVTARTTKN